MPNIVIRFAGITVVSFSHSTPRKLFPLQISYNFHMSSQHNYRKFYSTDTDWNSGCSAFCPHPSWLWRQIWSVAKTVSSSSVWWYQLILLTSKHINLDYTFLQINAHQMSSWWYYELQQAKWDHFITLYYIHIDLHLQSNLHLNKKNLNL